MLQFFTDKHSLGTAYKSAVDGKTVKGNTTEREKQCGKKYIFLKHRN